MLLGRPGEAGVTGNVYCGLHEFESMAFLLHAIRTSDLFLDVGANSGSYTVLASASRAARSICVEPVPSTYGRLLMNIHLNGLGSRVQAMNIGLADKVGFLDFTTSEDSANHVIGGGASGNAVNVEVKTLDEVCGGECPAIIKIDAEGYELPVLRGARATLSNTGLHSVIIELNGSGTRYGFDEKEILRLLENSGFKPCAYDPWTRNLSSLSTPHREGNTLFVRDKDKVGRLLAESTPFAVLGRQL
jgi:FkbM family methyltransferase